MKYSLQSIAQTYGATKLIRQVIPVPKIENKEDFYVSCADFYDKDGKKIDVDFLIIEDGERLLI